MNIQQLITELEFERAKSYKFFKKKKIYGSNSQYFFKGQWQAFDLCIQKLNLLLND